MITSKPAADSTSRQRSDQSADTKSRLAAVIYQRYQQDDFYFETGYDENGQVVSVCWYGNKGILEYCTSL